MIPYADNLLASRPLSRGPFMDLKTLLAPVQPDMQRVDALIRDRLASEVALIDQIGAHIVSAGGKRLRPALVLLSAGALGAKGDGPALLAATIEFIHTATLLHDDVVDDSSLRRGRQTANALWGNEAAVLSGDFLYSRAFQMMVDAGHMPVMRVMADATNAIAEGEVLQLLNCGDPDVTVARYLRVIELKTARLFEAACRVGAIGAGAPDAVVDMMGRYGHYLGMAFQLVDDVLDYVADAAVSGKALGTDLAEGKPTLPLIHARDHSDAAGQALVRDAISNGGEGRLDDVLKLIESSEAIPYTRALADDYGRQAADAVQGLPESDHRSAMLALAQFNRVRGG
jgi:octaprenyl-diphosphate synthase